MAVPETSAPEDGGTRGGFVGRHLLALIVLAAAVVFIVENRRRVRLHVFVPYVTMPLWEALAATLVAGMVIPPLIKRHRSRR